MTPEELGREWTLELANNFKGAKSATNPKWDSAVCTAIGELLEERDATRLKVLELNGKLGAAAGGKFAAVVERNILRKALLEGYKLADIGEDADKNGIVCGRFGFVCDEFVFVRTFEGPDTGTFCVSPEDALDALLERLRKEKS